MIVKRTYRNAVHVWSEETDIPKAANADEEKSEAFAAKKAAWEAAWKRFKETGEVGALPFKDGHKPTIWEIASLRLEQFNLIGNPFADLLADNEPEARRKCAVITRWGLVGARDFVDEDGVPITLQFDGENTKDRILKVDSLRDIGHPDVIFELGLRIYEVSKPSPLFKGA